MQIIAAAASVGAIALAGLTLLFLQTPGSQIPRSSPAKNVSVPTQAAPAAQVPERPGLNIGLSLRPFLHPRKQNAASSSARRIDLAQW
jgi:hypothetical protein